MDRGIKDGAFVRRALQEADFDMGRWIYGVQKLAKPPNHAYGMPFWA